MSDEDGEALAKARCEGRFAGWDEVAGAFDAVDLRAMGDKVRAWAAIARTFPENARYLAVPPADSPPVGVEKPGK